jgi:hypothetical protein
MFELFPKDISIIILYLLGPFITFEIRIVCKKWNNFIISLNEKELFIILNDKQFESWKQFKNFQILKIGLEKNLYFHQETIYKHKIINELFYFKDSKIIGFYDERNIFHKLSLSNKNGEYESKLILDKDIINEKQNRKISITRKFWDRSCIQNYNYIIIDYYNGEALGEITFDEKPKHFFHGTDYIFIIYYDEKLGSYSIYWKKCIEIKKNPKIIETQKFTFKSCESLVYFSQFDDNYQILFQDKEKKTIFVFEKNEKVLLKSFRIPSFDDYEVLNVFDTFIWIRANSDFIFAFDWRIGREKILYNFPNKLINSSRKIGLPPIIIIIKEYIGGFERNYKLKNINNEIYIYFNMIKNSKILDEYIMHINKYNYYQNNFEYKKIYRKTNTKRSYIQESFYGIYLPNVIAKDVILVDGGIIKVFTMTKEIHGETSHCIDHFSVNEFSYNLRYENSINKSISLLLNPMQAFKILFK